MHGNRIRTEAVGKLFLKSEQEQVVGAAAQGWDSGLSASPAGKPQRPSPGASGHHPAAIPVVLGTNVEPVRMWSVTRSIGHRRR